jgi:flavin reductase (DIM6/NTAB) family NADH-FMN oxidoreductase RutF
VKTLELDPRSLTEHQCETMLLWGVVPRPVAMVSTLSPEGVPNVAPFSYFTAIGYQPMSLLFCPGRRPDMSEKDSCRNARPPSQGGTGEFTVNLLTASLAQAATTAARPLPPGDSEYHLTGLTPVPGVIVDCPRIAESPIAFECRTTAVIPVGMHFVVTGEVVHLTVDDSLIDASSLRVDFDRLEAIGRMGAGEFVGTGRRFEIKNESH